MKPKVSIVVPIFNEQENVSALVKSIRQVFYALPYQYNIIFVDDGSSDATLNIVKTIRDYDPTVHYISFSRNFGHQSALKAGLDAADGDCVISMDGDMQHPPELIPQLLAKWEEGYDVVYTIRKEDPSLSYIKRKSSNLFYKLLNYISDVPLEKGTADFRLMSKKVVGIVRNLEDHELFLRGIVKWIGFKQLGIEYEPAPRFLGKSKYTLKKMVRLATEGITSFSIRPLYLATYLGITFSFLSILYVPYALYSYYFGKVISGWTSVIVTISFFGGLQLMILGVIGIYLGKLFMQTKQRPAYLIKESTIECQQKELFY
jgi:polyisoprenyl-phosphate glycosyltransferase